VQFQEAKCASKLAKATKRKQNAIENAEHIAATGLILDKDKITKLRGVAPKVWKAGAPCSPSCCQTVCIR